MSVRRFAALVGIVMFAIGLIYGLSTVTTRNNVGSAIACGSALVPDDSEAKHFDDVQRIGSTLAGGSRIFDRDSNTASQCDSAIGSRPLLAWTLVALGILVTLGSAVVRIPISISVMAPDRDERNPDLSKSGGFLDLPGGRTGQSISETELGDLNKSGDSRVQLAESVTDLSSSPSTQLLPGPESTHRPRRLSLAAATKIYKNTSALLFPLTAISLLAFMITPNYHEGWITLRVGYQDVVVHVSETGNNTAQAQNTAEIRGATVYSRSTPPGTWSCLSSKYLPLLDHTYNDWTYNPTAGDLAACQNR